MTAHKILNFKFTPQIFFGVLSLVIMLPLLKPGFIFALDMAFTPNMPVPEFASSSLPFHWLLHILAKVVPAEWLQKILLLAVIWLAGFGMYKLATYLLKDNPGETSKVFSSLIAGLFFVVNPYLFTRFMVGQLGVLMGYALLPWAARAILQFLNKPGLRTALTSSLLVTLISIVSIHSLGLILLFMVIGLLIKIYQQRRKLSSYLPQALKWSAAGTSIFLIIGSFWLVPLLLGRGYIADSISNFGSSDKVAFATVPDEPFGLVGNVAALYGFWADEFSLYVLPKDLHSWWWIVTLLLWSLMAVGVIYGIKYVRTNSGLLLGVGAISLSLAIGASFPPNERLASAIPWFAGYREPQKFAGLLCLVFSAFIGLSLYALLSLHRNQAMKTLLIVSFVSLVVLCTPTMLWGFGGQLKAAAYPIGWYRVNEKLRTYPGNFKVLFLPWHQYIPLSFAERTVVSPANKFFDKTIVASNQPELLALKPQVPNGDADYISSLFAKQSNLDQVGALKARNIRFVILAHEFDYSEYAYLNDSPMFRPVYRDETITLYEVL